MHFALLGSLLLLLRNIALASDSDESQEFGYEGKVGPQAWKGFCSNGTRQSPINIRVPDVDFESMPRLYFTNYGAVGEIILANNGHSVMASGFENWGSRRPYIYGGGLEHHYELLQFHFHWSQHNSTGSEHTIESLHYPAEIHLVHVRRGRNMHDGQPFEKDTIAVVAVFAALGNDAAPLSALEKTLPHLISTGSTADVFGFHLLPMLPPNLDTFYRYDGSLTTPGCDEAVVWTVMTEPISITHSQLAALRKVQLTNGMAGENYRPTMPLNGRRIKFRTPSVEQEER